MQLGHHARGARTFFQVVMLTLAVVFAFPIVVAFGVSFRGEGLQNYTAVLAHPLLPRFFLNSAIVSAVTILVVYLLAGFAAFALAKLDLRGRSLILAAIMVGLMVPTVALIVPLFFMVRGLGLFGNWLSVIVPLSALILPLAILLVRSFIEGIPGELLDAARIDGCGNLAAYWLIIRPLSRQIFIVVVIYSFLTSWNEYFLPLAFMQSPADRLVTQAPQYFVGQFGQDTGKVFASMVVISIPVVVAYLAFRRGFEDGITGGALK